MLLTLGKHDRLGETYGHRLAVRRAELRATGRSEPHLSLVTLAPARVTTSVDVTDTAGNDERGTASLRGGLGAWVPTGRGSVLSTRAPTEKAQSLLQVRDRHTFSTKDESEHSRLRGPRGPTARPERRPRRSEVTLDSGPGRGHGRVPVTLYRWDVTFELRIP